MKKILLLAVSLLFLQQVHAQNFPVIKNDTASVCLGNTKAVQVLLNDTDADGDSLYIDSILIAPSNGVAIHNGVAISYTPDAGFIGTNKVYYKVCDNSIFKQCGFTFLVLNVDTCIPINHKPTAKLDTATICNNSSAVLVPIINDTDSDGDSIAITQFLNPATRGVDSFVNGLYYYTPTDSQGTDVIRYVLCDFPISLPPLCDTGSIIITIRNCTIVPQANRAPVAQIDIVPALEDLFSLPFDPRSNDTDPDGDPLTWTALFGPLNGTVTPFAGQWIYRPNPNFNGIDFMPYRVCDNGSPQLCTFSVVTFIIAARNDPPTAVNDTVTVLEDTRTRINVLRNDSDIDGDIITVKQVNPAANGIAELINGQVFYTPNPNFYGQDVFQYRICDSSNACANAKVYITVLPVDDAPVAVNDSTRIGAEQSNAMVNVLENDFDVENDSIWIASVGTGNLVNASISIVDGKQVIVLTRKAADVCGTESISYQICGSGGCSTASISVEVACQFTGKLPEGFSPNGDGSNDRLVFENLADYNPLGLQVFNRWGDVVFETRDYQNDWNGFSQKEKQPLPDGTYYYVLKLNNGNEHIRYCVIQR